MKILNSKMLPRFKDILAFEANCICHFGKLCVATDLTDSPVTGNIQVIFIDSGEVRSCEPDSLEPLSQEAADFLDIAKERFQLWRESRK